MDAEKKEWLAKKGWVSVSVQESLELTPEEMDDLRAADKITCQLQLTGDRLFFQASLKKARSYSCEISYPTE